MIGENVATVVPWTPLTGVEFSRPPAAALASLLVYLAVIVAIATASFARRDITAGRPANPTMPDCRRSRTW